MKKIIFIAGIMATIVLFYATCYSWGSCMDIQDKTNEQVGKNIREQKESKDSIPANWEKYTSDNIGITFFFPNTWTKYGTESNAINRNGEVMSIMSSMVDTINNSIFSLEYHFPPYGSELYKNAQSQFDTSHLTKQIITVAGNKALKTFMVKYSDIKGNVYNPPLCVIQIVFLDKQVGGEYFLRFETPMTNEEVEIVKFNQVISTFKFIDDKPKNK
ncbi:MAG TPA: hypothetical protein PLZ12_04085 [Saprospiraceae bacterium]|nr:hypothetical protein [Saprospiraceae bacterium]